MSSGYSVKEGIDEDGGKDAAMPSVNKMREEILNIE